MKKLIFFLLLLVISINSFSQSTTITIPTVKTDYLKKSKHQKTAAWILLGSGPVLIIAGYITIYSIGDILQYNEDDNYAAYAGLVMATGGVLSMLVSIPFFIASAKNKKRSMSLSFKYETAPQIQKSSFVYKSVPSLTLKINL